LIAASAEAAAMDCIVTRNESDFSKSPVPALSPENYLARLAQD